MDDFYKFLQTFFGLIADAGSLAWEHVVDYKDFLWRLTKWFALFAAIPIPVLIICLVFRWPVNWLYSAYFIFVGAEAVILMVLAFPIIAAAQIIFDKFPQFAGSIRKSVQGIAAVAFWALMLAVYFYVFPVWENPKMIPLVFMVAAALALGTYAGLVRLPFGSVQTIATVFLVGIFVIATVAISFPNRMRQLVGFTQNIDIAAAQPNRLNISYEDTENGQIAFFRPSDGKPLVWYCETVDGRIELFDRAGYHPIYKTELKQVTPDIISKIKEQLKKEPVKVSEKPKEQLQQVDATQNTKNVEPSQPSLADLAARQKLMLATASGTSYIGTISNDKVLHRVRLAFTEQKGFLICTELSFPDSPNDKQTYTGQLVFEPQPESDRGRPDVAYTIVMNPAGKEREGSLRLRLTDTGLEGEMQGRNRWTIRLQREEASSVEQRKADEEAIRQKLIQATASNTSYIGTISYREQIQSLRVVFTEQKGFLIRAEASNPDRSNMRLLAMHGGWQREFAPQEKQTFVGELDFNPKPENGRPDVAYTIVLSSIGAQDWPIDIWDFYRRVGSLKLLLTDKGLEGEAQMSYHNYTIHLQRAR